MPAVAAPVLVAAPLPGRRPASFWRFEGSPAPGAGRTPVACLAGIGLDGRVFRRLAPLAAERDLLLVNLPNDLPPAPRMEDLAEEAFAALDAAGHGGRKAILLGSSFGGMAALAGALARPDRTAGLAILGGAAAWAEVPLHLRLLSRLHPLVPRRSYPGFFTAVMLPPLRWIDPDLRAELRTQMLHRTKGFVGSCIAAMRGFDARPRLGGIRAPTLFLHGDRDPVLPRRAAAAAAASIPGARFETVRDCGHLPTVTHGGPTAAALARFLGEAGL